MIRNTIKTRFRVGVMAAFLAIAACFFIVPTASLAQDTEPNSDAPNQQATSPPSDHLLFYTFTDDLPASGQLFHRWRTGTPSTGAGLKWRTWANKPKPFVRSLLAIFLFAVLTHTLIPALTARSQTQVKEHFWRSFLIGAVVTVTALIVSGVCLRSMLGWPLAIVTIGLLQLALLAGLAVVVSLLGGSVGRLLRFDSWSLLLTSPRLRRCVELLLGAFLCAALLQIPAIGMVPRIGPRLVALLGIIGLGALYQKRQIVTVASNV